MSPSRRDRAVGTTNRLLFLLCAIGVGVAIAGLAMPQAAVLPVGGLWRETAVRGVSAEHYSTMDSMALAADAVVLGRLRSIDPGPVYGESGARAYFASIRIDVDDVLQGSLRKGEWVLHHSIGDRDQVAGLQRFISEDRAIYFLRDLEREMLDLGFPANEARDVAGAYRLVTDGAVINDDHGVAVRPLTNDALDSVEGRDFGSIVARIRSLSD